MNTPLHKEDSLSTAAGQEVHLRYLHLLAPQYLNIQAASTEIINLTATEKQAIRHLPPKLGAGEVEAIAVCQERKMSFIHLT